MAIADVERVLRDICQTRIGRAGFGDPLFTYRVSEDEFARLTESLSSVTVAEFNGHVVCKKAFVLYAATWWNRRYSGGHWAWEPIFTPIGLQYYIDPNNRSAYVSEGLRSWGLKPVATQRAYLGAIVYNGGIPNHILTLANGALARFIARIIQVAPINALCEDYERIASDPTIVGLLAPVYQQTDFYKLVAELLVQLKQIIETVPANENADRVTQFDRIVPNWRDRLPLGLDSAASRELVNQIAGHIQGAVGQVPFPVTRWWIRDGDVWIPQITVEKRSRVMIQDLIRQFGPFNKIPKAVEVSIGGHVTIFELYRNFAFDGQFHVKGRDLLRRSDVDLESPVSVILRLDDDTELYARGNQFKSLDFSQIWRIHGDIADRRLKIKSVGPFRTSAQSVLVSIPHDSRLQNEAAPVCTFAGRNCYLLETTSIVESADGTNYVINVGDSDEDLIDVEFDIGGGNKYNDLLWSSVPVFSEHPTVQQFSDAVYIGSVPANQVIYGVRRARPGLSRVRVTQDENVVWSADYILLPDFDVSRSESGSGYVSFLITGLDHFIPVAVEGQFSFLWEGDVLTITTLNDRPLPPRVTVALANAQETRLSLQLGCPLPQPMLLTGTGELISGDQSVSLEEFASTRFYSDMQTREELVVVLENQTRFVTTMGRMQIGRNDVSLGRLWDKVEVLLSETDDLDASVTVRLEIGVQPICEFSVSRFGFRLIPDQNNGIVSVDPISVPSSISLGLINLTDALPVFELSRLNPHLWNVNVQGLSGPSLIFATNESQVSIRSLLWNADYDQEPNSTLLSAMCEYDPVIREARIRVVLSEMATNMSHRDWETCFRLLDNFKHLPLSTLDFVRLSIREPAFLVMLVFTMPAELAQIVIPRLEIELPFVWELVPLTAWRSGLSCILATMPAMLIGFVYERMYYNIRQFAGGRSAALAKSQHTVNPIIDWGQVRNNLLRPGACDQLNDLRIRMANMAEVNMVTPQIQGGIKTLMDRHGDVWGAGDQSLRRLIAAPVVAAYAQSPTTNEFTETFDHQTIMSLKLIRNCEPEWYDHAYQFCLETAGNNNHG
jgi:hypothetical protein